MNVDFGHGPKATFTLFPDDPANTTISDTGPDGTALYTVSTRRRWNGTTTYIANVHGEVLASLERRFILDDRIILGRNQPISLRDWIHMGLPNKNSIMETSFRDESGRKYKWRGHLVSGAGALDLFTKDDEYAQPIARFDRSRETADRSEEPATLTLTRRALEIRDLVVISFVFVEHERRKEEAGVRRSPRGDISALAMASYGRATVGSGW
uniref:Zn(2)-C6 fungal-type domain-containing protein n=1 Tax=Ganoderma boninense TaxID=34458 RepID=A0A5K1K4B1_9APHY|nr:Zn(2)-C6 fungal-type domain-containing protein [Ganoderma boninense]